VIKASLFDAVGRKKDDQYFCVLDEKLPEKGCRKRYY
jgi:hypothetical protein